MKTPAEVLTAARELIAEPARLVQGVLARDADGHLTYYAGPLAVRWSASGALMRAMVDWSNNAAHLALVVTINRAARELGYRSTAALNDAADHATVLRLFDRAIEIAKGEEK